MSAADSSSPAGSPSTITTRARPCDSPAVRKRNITRQRTGGLPGDRRRLGQARHVSVPRDDDVERGEGEGRPERECAAAPAQEPHREPEADAEDAAEEERDE